MECDDSLQCIQVKIRAREHVLLCFATMWARAVRPVNLTHYLLPIFQGHKVCNSSTLSAVHGLTIFKNSSSERYRRKSPDDHLCLGQLFLRSLFGLFLCSISLLLFLCCNFLLFSRRQCQNNGRILCGIGSMPLPCQTSRKSLTQASQLNCDHRNFTSRFGQSN